MSQTPPQHADMPSDDQVEVIDDSSCDEVIEVTTKTRKKTSNVWSYVVEDTANGLARCKKCNKVYSLGKNRKNGTGTLLRHIRHCYALDEKLEPIIPSVSVLSHFATITPGQKTRVLDRLMEWIICDQQALSVVEHPAFQAIFEELPGRYQLPSHTTISRKAFEQYEIEKVKIKTLLSSAPGNIALTCDGWESSNHQHYLGITAHWIDKNWKLQRVILDFPEFPLPRSAPAGKLLVKETMLAFGIDARVHSMVTDNTPSAYNISELMALDQDEWFFEQRCGAHVINLIIKHALEDEEGCEELAPMRALAVALHRKDRLRTILKAECERLGAQYHLPPLPCDTRWGSTLNLLEGLIKVKTALMILFHTHRDFLEYSWGDVAWQTIQDLITLLQPFNDLSKVIQGQDFPTIGLLGLGYDFIADRLRKVATGDDASDWLRAKAITFSRKAMRYTSEWFSNGTVTHWAILMDPAVKDSVLRRNDSVQALATLKANLVAHIDIYYQETPPNDPLPPRNNFLSELQDFAGSCFGITTEQQLESYLQEARVPADTSSALEYWKLATSRFPKLSQFARDILCVPATVAPSEAAFSRSGQLITSRRNRLHVDSVKILMCLDSWLSLERHNQKVSSLHDR